MSVNTRNSIVTNGLIMYFDAANPMSYTSGSTSYYNLNSGYTNITSSILSNQNGTITLPQYSSEGGGTFIFNGTGSVINVSSNPQNAGFWPLPSMSLEAWFKSPGTGSGQSGGGGILGFTYGIRMYINRNGANIVTAFNNSTSSSIIALIPGNYYDNRWHQIISQTNGLTTFAYLDGVLRSSTTDTIPWTGTSPWPTNGLNIGRDNNDAVYYFSGSIGPIRIYNRVLSAQEVLQNYNATKIRFGL